MIRLKVIGTEWEVVKRLTDLKSNSPDENWEVTFVTPVYGGWDLVTECTFTKLQELDKIVTFIRVDKDLSSWIEETTTLVSSKPDYPR
ncbi:MAG: hypothetical protein EAX91_05845 [Candidatus Lokiarchaeota archaeon]|nr:hypothetical protein [Candidatus Lokiarchaeota archaeon]